MDTGSHVDVKYRTYNRDETDLSVKTIRGGIDINRYFQDNRWYLGLSNYQMIQTLSRDENDDEIPVVETYMYTDVRYPEEPVLTSLLKNGVAYNLPPDHLRLKTEYDENGNIIDRKWDFPGGRVYRHKTYSIGKVEGGFMWENKNGEYHEYSEDGAILSTGNAEGQKASFTYGTNGRLSGIIDAAGNQVVWFDYNTQNQLERCRLSDNRQVEYFYTGNLLTKVVDVTGEETRYEYDDNNRLSRVVDANNNEKRITYADQNEVIAVKDQNGIGYTFEYNYDNYKKESYARSTSPSGKVTEVWIDEEGDTKRVAVNGDIVKKIAKDGRNEIITDANGLVTTKEYDEWDNLIKITYPDGTRVVNTYEHETNRITQKTDENLIIALFDYDGSGNLIRKTEAKDTADERITEYTHDDYGNILTITLLGGRSGCRHYHDL